MEDSSQEEKEEEDTVKEIFWGVKVVRHPAFMTISFLAIVGNTLILALDMYSNTTT